MAGSVRRKHQGWEITVSAGFDPATGRRRRVSRFVKGTKREAEQSLAQLLVDVGQGRHLGSTATLDETLAAWLALAERDLSPTTYLRYVELVRLHISPRLGTVPIHRLDASQLDHLYRALGKAGLAPATIRQVHAVIRRGLNQAIRWEWIPTNPAMRATPPRLERMEIVPPGPETVRLLLERARAEDDDDLAELLWLAAVTGARRGELCGMQWSDLVGDELKIARAVVVLERSAIAVKETKTHAVRKIAVDELTVELLRARRVRCAERALLAGVPLGPWMWSDDAAMREPLNPELVTQRFQRLCRRAGVVGVRLHDLRHFAATRMLDAGIAVTTAAKRLGHRDGTITVGIYGHRVAETDREAARILGQLIGPQPAGPAAIGDA
jgi:integrase